jgi:nicotinate dehydrogenase subunit B
MDHTADIVNRVTLPPKDIDRRDFLKRLGAGLTIAVALSDFKPLGASTIQQRELPTDWNAFLKVEEDGSVTCYTGKIEMGQGINTSLAQMLAEELEVDVAGVKVVMGDTLLCPYDAGTWGSLTTRYFGPPLRAAAAEARAVLLQMASERFNVHVDQLRVEDGVVYDRTDRRRSVSYAELIRGKTMMRSLKEKPSLKKPSEFKVIGKPLLRTDSRLKVTGEAKYSADIRLPGMKYAAILRPPAHGARMISVDTAPAEAIEGIEIIRDGDFIAVIHSFPETAMKAVRRIKAEWDIPEARFDDNTIFEHLVKVGTERRINQESGNIERGRENARHIIETEFHDCYVAHAPIETHTATAVMEGDTMVIWGSTQTPFGSQGQVARALDMPPEKVHIKEVYLGGGFGGKASAPQVVEAARIAKLSGKPIQLTWSRDEEFFYDTFHSAAVIKVASSADEDGKITLYDSDIYFAGGRSAELFYDVPHHRITVVSDGRGGREAHAFSTGPWRAPGAHTNVFARECQLDIMSHAAGIDPLDFRLRNTKNERVIRTLRAAAEKFGWTPISLPSGKGRGMAVGYDAGTYVAMIGEVEVDEQTGRVQVLRVVTAQDMGMVINPQGALIQVEGCINMGMGYAFSEEIFFEGGNIRVRNFNRYDIGKFSTVPLKLETVLLDLPDEPPQGGGEPAIVTVGAMIGNAIFDACGARLLRLPMTPERVKEAIQKG